jgi:thiosulfate dehydrogenase
MKSFYNHLFVYGILFIFICFVITSGCSSKAPKATAIIIPDTTKIPNNKTGDEIRYGRDLYMHTAYYLGPKGVVMKLCGNKMNCMNCHLDVGERPFSNDFLETYLKYPQYRAREGMVLTIEDRINNCFERPMNGKQLPYDSREMRAMVAYLRWLCEGKVVSYKDDSIHLGKINFIDRAANVRNGEKIFISKCAKCHQPDGQGQLTPDKETYIYPPLWGMQSYAQGSSMNRNITAARFIKWSMPYVDKRTPPQITDEEAFDVAAFINCDSIHPRPYRPLQNDCPDLTSKPIDFPAGPFLDTFPVRQHIYGPFAPIRAFYDARK